MFYVSLDTKVLASFTELLSYFYRAHEKNTTIAEMLSLVNPKSISEVYALVFKDIYTKARLDTYELSEDETFSDISPFHMIFFSAAYKRYKHLRSSLILIAPDLGRQIYSFDDWMWNVRSKNKFRSERQYVSLYVNSFINNSQN